MKAGVSSAAVPRADSVTRLAGGYLDYQAERNPALATRLGDHRFDAHLADQSEAALAAERRALDGWSARLGALDGGAVSGPSGSAASCRWR
ncbi:MAG: hypothetical protein ACRDPY_08750 [Streptosporangiaceae bacterium]